MAKSKFKSEPNLFAVQRLNDGLWETEQLFAIREFAEARVSALGEGYRVEPVKR